MTSDDARGVRVMAVVRELSTWCPPSEVVRDLLTHMGAYTDVLVERWAPDGPTDAAMAWTDPHTLPSDATELFHKQGIRVSLVAGGAPRHGGRGKRGANEYASSLADFVRAYCFDGVHLSCLGSAWNGSLRGIDEVRTTDWLCWVTEALHRELPGVSLSHSHHARQFGPHDAARVRCIEARVGSKVEFYVAHYEEVVCTANGACDAVFSSAPAQFVGTAVDELIGAGFPPDKLVAGLPVALDDGQGYVELHQLVSTLRARAEAQKPTVGLCGWYWATDRRVLGGRWSTRVTDAILGEPRGGETL